MRYFLILCVLMIGALAAPQNIKEHFKIDTSKRVDVNFRSATLEYTAFKYTQMTGITVIVNPSITSKISIFSSGKMSIESAYEVLFASLGGCGAFAVIKDGIIIIDRKPSFIMYEQPWQEPLELRHYRLKYAPADSVSRTLNSLFLSNLARSSFETYSNILIVYAPVKTHELIKSIIPSLDVETLSSKTKLFKLEYGFAAELAPIISNTIRLMDRGNSVVSYDYRTNSLIVTASNDSLAYVGKIIEKLDTKLVMENNRFVIKLKSARSQELSDLIRSLLGTPL